METSLHAHFSNIADPRVHRHKKHYLIDIIILTILAVICGAESWDSIELFGKTKITFLRKILKLPNGIPSHDTINRVFSMLNSRRFEEVFIQWANTLTDKRIKDEVIAIDGKAVRRSKDSYHGKSPIHLVNAWATKNHLVLGQYKTDSKSNEISAIPELLELLDIEASIITIDAMGTQTKIAQKIVDAKANYILSLKDNQKELKEEVESIFEVQTPEFSDETIDKGHGRLEIRKCDVINNLEFVAGKEKWAKLSSIVRISSERTIRNKTETETRYYISSLNCDAASFNLHIRSHWGVENSLHWTLDMTFREDEQRKRNGKAAQNFAIVNKIALNLLRKDKSKGSIKSKRLKAGWDDRFLYSIINNYMR